ncbi:ribokinase [Agromyces sp. MMS24-K17]|uniref:ribokinase n=1 Tax=Agromyces sp. MMS24-K17 TaxID=3372850 RepID=UPI0037541E47
MIGSLNVDTTTYVREFPAPGETIAAHGLRVALGGKGTNQAVAAHRFGADVALIARVGADAAAGLARDTLAGFGLVLDGIAEVADAPTGAAAITVADSGENTVIVVAGANERLGPAAVDAERARVAEADVALTQGEVPVATIERLAAVGDEAGTRFVLNLAPPVDLAAGAIAVADPLVVNEHEARTVGIAPAPAAGDATQGNGADASSATEPDGDATRAAWLDATRAVVAAGLARSVVVTLGGAGAVAASADGGWAEAAPRVTPVDTTGAGDGFTGTLAAALAEGRPLDEAVRIAIAAGALAVQARGTVDSYATRDAVLALAGASDRPSGAQGDDA